LSDFILPTYGFIVPNDGSSFQQMDFPILIFRIFQNEIKILTDRFIVPTDGLPIFPQGK